jgi:hypothetical protein
LSYVHLDEAMRRLADRSDRKLKPVPVELDGDDPYGALR